MQRKCNIRQRGNEFRQENLVILICVLGVVKRNYFPLFLHEIEWKNNGFLFTTPNIILTIYFYILLIYLF